jgi:hypothetical protein
LEVVVILNRWVGRGILEGECESFPEASHMEHLSIAADSVGLTGQLSIEVMLVGELPKKEELVSSMRNWELLAMFIGLALALVEARGVGLSLLREVFKVIKERMDRGEDLVDSVALAGELQVEVV